MSRQEGFASHCIICRHLQTPTRRVGGYSKPGRQSSSTPRSRLHPSPAKLSVGLGPSSLKTIVAAFTSRAKTMVAKGLTLIRCSGCLRQSCNTQCQCLYHRYLPTNCIKAGMAACASTSAGLCILPCHLGAPPTKSQELTGGVAIRLPDSENCRTRSACVNCHLSAHMKEPAEGLSDKFAIIT